MEIQMNESQKGQVLGSQTKDRDVTERPAAKFTTVWLIIFMSAVYYFGFPYFARLLKVPTALETPMFFLTAVLTSIYAAAIVQVKAQRESKVLVEKKIEQIEVKAEQEPEKTRFAWDLARVKLEAYFDRNLSQVKMIFFVAVAVMIVGFTFIM